jgi:hypothetical protein
MLTTVAHHILTLRGATILDQARLLSMRCVLDETGAPDIGPELAASYRAIGRWISSYLMSAHAELGRSGDVCPFTAQAFRLDTIRIGVSDASGADVGEITRLMRSCCRELRAIPCPESLRHFRTIGMGFPAIRDEDGLENLRAVQTRLKAFALLRGLMIGRFHPNTDDPGLWNPDFRPLRSPIPILAIRYLVANDAPFALRHPLLMPAYLARVPVSGAKRQLACLAGTR